MPMRCHPRGVFVSSPSQVSPCLYLENLEARLLLEGAAPAFVTSFATHYFLPGGSLAIGLEASDADISGGSGDKLTYSVTSQTPGVTAAVVSQSNRYAALRFVGPDGVTSIGNVIVQLFEDRAPTATERFITLALNGFNEDGETDSSVDPFYTNVLVHRVIPDFMIQTGDAENGDGTGGSPLGAFPDAFDPLLTFDGPGVLAFANSGSDTSDSQFFITAAATSWLNGGYFIFGQMVSPGVDPATGETTYDTIINTPTGENDQGENSSPLEPPYLQSVGIFSYDVAAGRYGTILLQTDGSFTGDAQLTVTVTDQTGNQASQTISVIVPYQGSTVTATSGVETSFYVDLSTVSDPVLSSPYDGAIYSLDPSTWKVTAKAPAGYSGAFALTLYDSDQEVSSTVVLSQNPDDPQLQSLIPDSDASVMCSLQDGDLLYAGLSSGGIRIYDISDPKNPSVLGSLAYSQWDGSEFSEAFNSVLDVKLSGGRLYALDTDLSSSGRLTCVDVTDPSQPLPLGSVQTGDIPYSLGISGNRAIVADLSLGLTSYDISDPANPRKYSREFTALPNGMTVNEVNSVAIKGQYACFSAKLTDPANLTHYGLIVVDISNPANMTFAGAIGTYLPIGLDIEGNRLFLMEWLGNNSSVSRLSAYDLSSPAAPKYLSSVQVPGNGWQLDVRGDMAVVVPRDGTSVTFLDVGDPLHMHVNYTFTNDTLAEGETSIGYKPSLASSLAAVGVQGLGTMIFDVAGLTDLLWVDSRMTLLDENSTPVTVRISGGGSIKVIADGGSSGHIQSIEVFSAGAATKVSITTPYGKTTSADEIIIHGSAGSFVAKTTDLAGDMTVEGTLATLALRNVTSGAIDIHTNGTFTGLAGTSITLGVVSDVGINTHGLAIRSLTVSQWLDGDANAANDMVTAPRLDRLTTQGDFAASLAINGTAGSEALGNVRIGGTLGDGLWDITGNVGKLTLGPAQGSTLDVTGKIGSLSVASASGVSIDALRIDRLTATGDFAAEMTLQGGGTAASLGSARIGGGAGGTWNITGSTGQIAIRGQANSLRVSSTGNMASLTLGAVKDSNFLAGFNSSFSDPHPDSSDDFVPSLLSSIGSIRVTGLKIPAGSPVPRFVENSNFSAARIGAVQLMNVNLGNSGLYALAGGATSGIKSVRIADSDPLWKLDPAHNWSWQPKDGPAPDIIHLI